MSDKSKKNPVFIFFKGIRGLLKTIGTFLATFIMVGTITGCIVGCVLAAYILTSIDAEEPVSLDDIQVGYTSVIYYYDKQQEEYLPLQNLYMVDNNRTWVDYENIPTHVRNAMVAIEDKRFWSHQGVDWKRTLAATINYFIPVSSTQAGGGSTVHQQLLKNITGDDAVRVDRKVREIFRALNLAKNYTHDQVLETYLNVIPFGAGTNGIQAAANTYFGKDTWELSVAEAASIVGITKFPGLYNPLVNPEKNKDRQEYVLFEMHEQGYLTDIEYEKALAEELVFKKTSNSAATGQVQSWFVDHVIEEVIDGFVEQYGWDRKEATRRLYSGGYHIKATVDMDIQSHLENFYSTSDNFPAIHNTEYPQSASVIIDPNGKILGLVGGIGEKTINRGFNRATMAKRQPGSSIKPLGVYAMGFEYNTINWSTMIDDYPTNPEKPSYEWYPRNYYGTYLRMVTIDQAIQRSINTIPVKLANIIGYQTIFDFMHDDLHLENLVERRVTSKGEVFSDIGPGSLALGGLTDGLTPLEMVGAYQIFANGGYYTEPYCYTEVRDSKGNIVLTPDLSRRQVLSPETAELMNKLLQRVVYGPNGTGAHAAITGMPTAGKTGTSSDDVDQWFIGMTPYYICQVWLGYDQQLIYDRNGNLVKHSIDYYTGGHAYPPPVAFKRIMQPLHEELEYKAFETTGELVSRQYCLSTGFLAGANCTNLGTGWYKPNALPRTCNGVHASAQTQSKPANANSSSSAADSDDIDGDDDSDSD